jgi:vacuolar-type H+-ATPase subunit F/Vma7
MLRWLKTVVVSDEGKAHGMRQAGTRKTTVVEASKLLDDIRTGAMVCVPG